jgi:hypothetical protein
MLSDDIFKTRLHATIAGLEAWLAALRNITSAEIGVDEASWRAAVVPHVAAACPFELMLRVDQRFDLGLGGEIYEDQPIETLDLFQPLLAAVVAGRVIRRTWHTTATGTAVRLETIVHLPDGGSWIGTRQIVQLPTDARQQIMRDRHFAPYERTRAADAA